MKIFQKVTNQNLLYFSVLKIDYLQMSRDYKFILSDHHNINVNADLELLNKIGTKISINSLYNIFKHEKRVLNDHEMAYQFINNIFNKNNDNNSICILFESLDSTKISNESFNDLISKRKEHFGFLPPVNYSSFIDNIMKDLELKCDHSLSLFFTQMQKQQQQQQQFLNDIYQFLNQKIGTIQNDIKSLSEKIQIIDTKIDKTSAKIGEQYKQYIDPKIINIQSKIEDIKNKTEETNNCAQQISKKTEETNNCVQQISKKNDSVLHCIQFQSHGIIRQLTKEYGGNIHDKGVINVTASSVYDNSSYFQARCAVDLDNTVSRFTTKNELNSWLI